MCMVQHIHKYNISATVKVNIFNFIIIYNILQQNTHSNIDIYVYIYVLFSKISFHVYIENARF